MNNTGFTLIDSINVLGEAIKEHQMALNVTFSPGNKINMPTDFSAVIYIESGFAGLYHDRDDCLISEVNGPCIIGLTYLFFDNHSIYLKFNSESRVFYINQLEFISVCDKRNLWRNVSQIIASAERKLYSSPSLSSFRNAYDIVKFYLESIWTLPEHERKNVSIYQYILERSRLSRSSLHKIIRELNVGGYIKTERGRLVDINRLPVRY